MNKRFFMLASAIVMTLAVGPAGAQIDPALLQKAKAAGVTQEQIDAAKASQSKADGNTTPTQSSQKDTKIDRNKSRSVTPVINDTTYYYMRDESNALFNPNNRNILNMEDIRFIGQVRTRPGIFGQDIFMNKRLTFTPNYNMATPKDYVLGPGDELVVEVWGASELNARIPLTPEGTVNIQGIGPVQLSGYTIEEAEKKIKSKLASIMGIGSGTNLKVSLGEMRSINVNVVGEVVTPGTYTLPSLATVFNVLYAAGGVNPIGSLRNIKVFRNSKEVASLDVYDYLINGKFNENVRLENNDMIIVSPYDAYVSISGQVKRGMIYEMKKNETLDALLDYAGGFRGEAYTDNVQVRRKAGRQYQLLTVDAPDFASFTVSDGDSVIVGEIIDLYSNRLTIKGAVWRPGEYEFSPQLNKLSQLIAKAENLKGNEFASRGQITRLKPDFTYEVIPFDVRSVVTGAADIELQAEDEIYIPTISEMTEEYRIIVRGEVNKPDTIPFRYNMTIEDAIILAGGLKESASMAKVEVARRVKDPKAVTYTNKTADIYSFNIAENLAVSPEGNSFVLNPFDEIYIRRSPAYSEQQNVMIGGEVLFGGNYALARSGERLSEVVKKAGGVTPEAYVRGASLKRVMTPDERAKVEAKLSIASSSTGKDSLDLNSLSFDTVYPVGIDLVRAMKNPGSSDDIVLRDGDRIFIPKFDNTVKISGSVLYANTVTYDGSKISDYISQAGGYKDGARKRPFIIYMNGKIASTRRGFLCRRYPKVEPGCEIIVPMKQVNPRRMGIGEIMSLASSTTSMAAMISTLVK